MKKVSRHYLKIEKRKNYPFFYIQFAFSLMFAVQSVSTILFVADLSKQQVGVDMCSRLKRNQRKESASLLLLLPFALFL